MEKAIPKIKPRCVGKDACRYKDVKLDEEGFADASLFSPFPFDLVECVVKQNSSPTSGWFTGGGYYGIRMGDKNRIYKWRRNREGDPLL